MTDLFTHIELLTMENAEAEQPLVLKVISSCCLDPGVPFAGVCHSPHSATTLTRQVTPYWFSTRLRGRVMSNAFKVFVTASDHPGVIYPRLSDGKSVVERMLGQSS
jgi:hypothetical protein